MLKRIFIFVVIFSLALAFVNFSTGFAETHAKNVSPSEFDGKIIALQTGTIHDAIVREALPSAEILYFENDSDAVMAVFTGKADAYADDEERLNEIIKENDKFNLVDGYLKTFDNALIFSKTPQCDKLRGEFNEYFERIKSDGTLNNISDIWLGDDENLKILSEYENLPDINGIIKIATDNEAPPFDYVKDGRIAGYEADIIVHFCKEKGYKPVFVPGAFGSIIPSVASGKCDIGMGLITVTEERAQSVNFSVPTYTGGTRLLVLKSSKSSSNESHSNEKYAGLSALEGKRIGVTTGTTHPQIAAKFVPTAELVYFDSPVDTLLALKAGKIDAACTGIPMLREIMTQYDGIMPFGEQLTFTEGSPIFAKNDKGKKLCDQFSEFAKACWDNGIIKDLDNFWFEQEESKRIMKDYSNLPAPNGILTMAVNEGILPFIYMKDNKIVGYDIDFAVRFCEAYGYGLEIVPMNFSGIIPAVMSGKCDLGMGAITITDERKESVLFSYPNVRTGNIFAVRKPDINLTEKKSNSLSDLKGRKIGIILGANHDIFAAEKIPDVKIEYFNDLSAITLALKTGKIDAFANTLPTAIYMTHEHKDISYISEPLENTYTYSAFTNSEKGRKICDEYSEFIKSLWDDGTIKKLSEKWIYNEDESLRTIEDYSKLPATNGVLRMAIDTGRMPFAYVKNNKITGYDIELATMFCKAKGYGLEVYSMNFSGILGAIKSGKCDLTGSITRTEERAETMLFSPVPNAETPIVLLVMKDKNTALSEFNGKKIGVQIGTTCAELIPEKFPSSEVSYFNSLTDNLTALTTGKIDAMCCALPSAIYAVNENSDLEIVEPYLVETYLYSIFVSSDRGQKLCEEYSDYLKTLWDNGTIDELSNKWLGADDSKKTVDDYSKLPAINGTLKMAVDTSIVPFAYVKNNKIVGHAVDLAVRFCKAKGYALEISDMSLSAVIASVKAGKSDFSQAMTKSKERGENTIFATSPSIKSGNVLLTIKSKSEKPAPVAMHSDTPSFSFLSEIAASFERTFIREDRYKLFIEGIINTMIITVLSIFFGMILGFTVFMLCRTGNIFANIMTKFSVWLIKGTPIVVLLMIFYYIIFGKVNINGILVSIIVFTLTFGTSVYRMLTFGTGAIDKGQTEAAYALGYTDLQTFFTIILPQAALHFMPSFREEVTMLIKSTSVVGYIAVQDLTKMGDIVRSRTYEAFFPLIAVAVIYFILAGLLNVIVLRIQWKITPSTRKPEDILKGIKINL